MTDSLDALQRNRQKCQDGAPLAGDVDSLRVLMVTPRYFPYVGGVENHVYQVARRLATRGVNVTVLTTDPSGYLIAEEKVEGVQIRRVWARPSQRDYYFAPGIYREITRGPWNVVHVQSYHTLVAPLAMFAALRAGLPYIVTFHGGGHSSSLRNAMRGVQQMGLRPLLARAARLVALARFEIEYFGKQLHLPRERFALIPNGADIVTSGERHGPRDANLIASVGRLERYKGHQRMIAALPYILARRPDARLWIAGSGPYEPALRRLAKQLGVEAHVEVRAIPASEREMMAEELSRAALVTLLSEYETQPIAVLEALALGCPVLVADTSGMSELAEQGLARAIPLHSTPQEVAAAVLNQLEHAGVPSGLELPTWDGCTRDLLALYQAVVRSVLCVS
jgi:glycogen synthase